MVVIRFSVAMGVVLLMSLYSIVVMQNLRSAGEYYTNELVELEKETKALDRVAQKLELELRKSMAAGEFISDDCVL